MLGFSKSQQLVLMNDASQNISVKGEPMCSGHGRRPNSRVHKITGEPEQSSQILFVVHILGCFGNVMSMGWPPFHTLFSLCGGLFGDPMPNTLQPQWRDTD